MTAISKIKSSLFDWHREIPATTLAFYRIGFGALMLFSTIRFLVNGWVYDFYIEPTFHFSYFGFEWIPYPNPTVLYFIFAMMILSTIGIMLGFFYRISAFAFFVLFTYVELLDKTTYLNHYYFVSLIALLMIFLPANRFFSLDAHYGFTPHQKTVPNWTVGILKFQIAIVYIFAGIAKLESDWLLNAQPLKYWLHTAHHFPLFGDLLKEDWVAYFFSWFGCVYDLLIVFFLLTIKTRNFAYIIVIIFHATTWILFPIGVFPWVMIFATTIFLSENLHSKCLGFLGRILNRENKLPNHDYTFFSRPNRKKLIHFSLGLYISFQILFPFRYLLYHGNLFWTEQGYRFSWRVMLMEKTGYAEFYIRDTRWQSEYKINNSDHLTKLQEKMMSTQPDMILEYATYLQKEYTDTTLHIGEHQVVFNNPEVHAEIYVTLNGRPSQIYVDKSHNLAAIANDLSNRDWLEDFKE